MNRLSDTSKYALLYFACISGAAVFLLVVLTLTGNSYLDMSEAFLEGSTLNAGKWGETLTAMVPIALVALGAIVCFEAGYVNIGQEGQLLVGGAAAAYVGIHFTGPGPLVLAALLICGALAGAIWAGISALLKFWRGVPEVLTTLLLVMVAFQVTGYGLKTTSLIADPNPVAGSRNLSSPELAENSRLGEFEIFSNQISIGIFIALFLAGAVWLVMNRTLIGFRLKTLGRNSLIARRAGISEISYGSGALLFSGGMAGLAGATILASGLTSYSFSPGFSLNFGWGGLLVALVIRGKAWLAILAAGLFAGFHTGSQFLAATGASRQIGNLTQGIFVLALLIPPAVIYLWQRRPAFSGEIR